VLRTRRDNLKLFTAAIFSKITHSVALLIDQGRKFSQYKAWEDVEVREAPEDRRQSKKVFRSPDRPLEPMFWIPGTGYARRKRSKPVTIRLHLVPSLRTRPAAPDFPICLSNDVNLN
jgi:hypothetical protein